MAMAAIPPPIPRSPRVPMIGGSEPEVRIEVEAAEKRRAKPPDTTGKLTEKNGKLVSDLDTCLQVSTHPRDSYSCR